MKIWGDVLLDDLHSLATEGAKLDYDAVADHLIYDIERMTQSPAERWAKRSASIARIKELLSD
jgi:hypothetical protein